MRKTEETSPPWVIVDGRDDRTRNIDSEIRVWHLKHPAPEIKRPSKIARECGIRLAKKFGIAICTRRPGVRSRSKRFAAKSNVRPCGYLIIVKRGEKLPRCNGCGARVWVNPKNVIFQHDNPEVVKTVISSIKGWQGRGGSLTSILFIAKTHEWARRAENRMEEKAEMERFYDHLPWNLGEGSHARRAKYLVKNTLCGASDCAAPGSTAFSRDFNTLLKPEARTKAGRVPRLVGASLRVSAPDPARKPSLPNTIVRVTS